MSNRRDIQFTYNPHNKATLLDCKFVVNSSDTAGLGVTNFNGSGRVGSVFMHTSATPGHGSNGLLNPNPASGYILVTLQDNYNSFLGWNASITAPISGTPISISGSSVLTVGQVYVIQTVGTSTQANWVAVGLPSYITAAVGVSFVASVTGGGTGTGTVEAVKTTGSGIQHLELIGKPSFQNSTGANVLGGGVGMTLMFACFAAGGSSAAPTFTGDALATHSHNLLVKGGQIASTTNDVATYAGPVLGKQEATDATILGSASAASGGVIAASAGTPSGTISAPAFTSANAIAAPANASLLHMWFYLNNSAQGV